MWEYVCVNFNCRGNCEGLMCIIKECGKCGCVCEIINYCGNSNVIF